MFRGRKTAGRVCRCYRYRLVPNSTQRQALEVSLETHRRLYNEALGWRRLAWDVFHHHIEYRDTQRWLARYRHSSPEIGKIGSAPAQLTLQKLERAYSSFFSRLKKGSKARPPRFKGKDDFHQFTYLPTTKLLQGNRLRVYGIGDVKVRLHRPIPQGAKVKQVAIVRERSHWFCCLFLEMPTQPSTCGTGSIGIDLGIRSFVTTSSGDHLGQSDLLRQSLKKMRRLQRRVSRCKRRSGRRRRAKASVSSLHAKIRNARRDMQHKVARNLINTYELIAVEKLNVQGMRRNRSLGLSITDAAWSQFVGLLTYKAEDAGGRVILVDPRYTSQNCSGCGETVPKSLSERVHRCPHCHLVMDRDQNAALNILQRAIGP